MTTINIPQEQVNASNQETTHVSNFDFLKDVAMFIFGLAFVATASHMLNESSILNFNEQLSIINKPHFSGFLMILFGVLFFFKTLYSCVSIAIHGEKIASQFSSIWVPIKFAIFTTFFIPFEHNGSITSPIVENIKWIVQLVAN